ncbi:hypothetical protein GCM10011499_10150 [Pelagibacterium lentulum]|uniref:Uncharacterized protein n=2 Tax=Pelagibacterium lentulum TaxID=2029865 RepID=A0A916VVF6_9HYPH|nr:hypothetical protein GCM10011499_10150 [Pelagibacterium lentulum]
MKTEELKNLVDKHIAAIEGGTMTPERMVALYGNIDRQEALDEIDRERLAAAIEQTLRSQAPRQATKLFGPKDEEARQMLQLLWDQVEQEFDLTGNHHRNGVKIGGAMINGTLHLDVYLSYRNGAKETASINVRQLDAASDRFIEVRKSLVGGEVIYERSYSIAQYRPAFDDFREQLSSVL